MLLKRSLLLALASGPLLACEQPPTTPAEVAPVAMDGGSLVLTLPWQGSVLRRWDVYTRNDIHHLQVELYKVVGGVESFVTSASVAQAQLSGPISFDKLKASTVSSRQGQGLQRRNGNGWCPDQRPGCRVGGGGDVEQR